jgi:hypothetical protein
MLRNRTLAIANNGAGTMNADSLKKNAIPIEMKERARDTNLYISGLDIFLRSIILPG